MPVSRLFCQIPRSITTTYFTLYLKILYIYLLGGSILLSLPYVINPKNNNNFSKFMYIGLCQLHKSTASSLMFKFFTKLRIKSPSMKEASKILNCLTLSLSQKWLTYAFCTLTQWTAHLKILERMWDIWSGQ